MNGDAEGEEDRKRRCDEIKSQRAVNKATKIQ